MAVLIGGGDSSAGSFVSILCRIAPMEMIVLSRSGKKFVLEVMNGLARPFIVSSRNFQSFISVSEMAGDFQGVLQLFFKQDKLFLAL